jgi:hypothetical protein
MLSKRVMVIAADKALQKRLAQSAMAAGGAAQSFASVDEAPARLDSDLILFALPPREPGVPPIVPPSLARLSVRMADDARLVPIIPAADLEWTVALLADAHVPCVLAADGLSAPGATATVAKLLGRDLFGVDKVLPWGVRVYSTLVSDYHEKSQAILTIGDFAQAMGVRRKYREQIDQCIDEMLMNALYDAPVDAQGKPLFADVPVKERVLMRAEEKAILQYACDGERFVVSVRDAFGTLRKDIVLRYLDKCLHAAEQIDRKAGGAGLGLYLMCNSATEVSFHIFSGAATEVVCSFDLKQPRAQLQALAVYEESVDSDARSLAAPPTLPSRRGRRHQDLAPLAPPLPPQSAPRSGVLLPVMLTFAVLLLLFAVGLAGLPYLHRTPPAALRLESEPPGARVYVDGRVRGIAPLRVDGLEAGHSYALRATLEGWRDDEQLVTASAGDATVRLRLGEEHGVVALESEPGGARLVIAGQDAGKLTPATLELAAGAHLEVSLRKDGFVDQTLTLIGPKAGERALYRAVLTLSPRAALLTIASEPADAQVSVDGLTLAPPAPSHDTFVAPDSRHKIRVSAPGFVDERAEVVVGGGEHKTVSLSLHEGGTLAIKLNLPARVSIDGKPVGTAPLPPLGLAAGEHTLALEQKSPPVRWSAPVTLRTGQTLEVRLDFRADHSVAGHVGDRAVSDKW